MRTKPDKSRCRTIRLTGLAMAVVMAFPPPAGAQDVSSKQVQEAIERGVAYLRKRQMESGYWPDDGSYPGGSSALAILALLNAGVPANDPAVVKGLDKLGTIPNQSTYVVALKCQAYAAADPKLQKYGNELKAAVAWLVSSQCRRAGGLTGTWGYSARDGGGDNSNTQFALLGLHEAAKTGVEIKSEVWETSKKHFVNTQNADGGWGYRGKDNRSYGSMTAAGLASLFICGQRLDVGGAKVFVNGVYPDCGKFMQNEAVVRAVKWLTDNFSATENPKFRQSWLLYYLYAVERAGMISGLTTFGRHDWYRQGAAKVIQLQDVNGSWSNGVIYETAFGVLFLAKGNRPVLFQKIQWDENSGKWNRNLHDLENLTGFIGDKLGKPTTWLAGRLSQSLDQLRVAPILFITGHEFPVLTDQEKTRLKEFVDSGGTLLFEACCGQQAFADGFHALAKELWPQQPLRKLKPGVDLVYESYYKIDQAYDLEGIDAGCRAAVFFSPRALSCLWELQTIPEMSDLAFKLGTNIAAYATARDQLATRLDVVRLPEQKAGDVKVEVPRGAVRIARLIHNGDYNADSRALIVLCSLLREKAGIDVVARDRYIKPDEKELFDYPVIFMTGHFSFEFTDSQIKGLGDYLRKGGVLVAEACCGKEAFDASFRQMVKKALGSELSELPADHPIYSGKIGLQLGDMKYRHVLAQQLGQASTRQPPIETIELDGRTVILYSKYDYSCALEGDRPYSCKGYQDEDGKKLALCLFLYAISY
ncbi:MAG: DUF4159 domain-containing protein [Planctomycetes bacterium]|nr:DUF4159 domain-containing protein [Planctomycetota bacterium]